MYKYTLISLDSKNWVWLKLKDVICLSINTIIKIKHVFNRIFQALFSSKSIAYMVIFSVFVSSVFMKKSWYSLQMENFLNVDIYASKISLTPSLSLPLSVYIYIHLCPKIKEQSSDAFDCKRLVEYLSKFLTNCPRN